MEYLSRLFNQLDHLFNMSISFVINICVYSCGCDDTHQSVLRDYIFSRNYKIYLMARFTNSPMFLFLLNPIVRFSLNCVPIVRSFLRCQYFLIILWSISALGWWCVMNVILQVFSHFISFFSFSCVFEIDFWKNVFFIIWI